MTTKNVSSTNSILKSKLFLYLTEFFAGMSVMAVELGASRLLAPYFSSSQIVWTIIIGTIMIAMALGNIYGGRMADKNPNPDKLYCRILFAAVWIALIPLVGKYVIVGICGLLILFVKTNFLIWAAFAACMLLFVFPLFLLGTVTPSLVKYTTDSLDNNGKTVGNLGAYNTIGSIIGTFLPTFVTIPAVGTSITFLIFAGILMLLCFLYLLGSKKHRIPCAVAVLLFILCCIFGSSRSFAFWESNLTYEGESIYNYLQVKETDSSMILSTNVLFGVQSIMKKDGGLTGMYYDYALAAPVLSGIGSDTDAKILILGMGTGTYAAELTRYFPKANVTGVEIDQKIADLAAEYFQLPSSVNTVVGDGRAYLDNTDSLYDVIMVDAYQDITIPFQMSSVEFFSMVKSHLKENGVMVVNLNMHSEKKGSMNEYLCDTIASVFPYVSTADVTGNTNKELFASVHPLTTTEIHVQDENLFYMLTEVLNQLTPYQAGSCILTDDKAPVELLGMDMIDDLITDELGYYRGIYEEQGIKGLIEHLR